MIELILPDGRPARFPDNEAAARELARLYADGFTGLAAGCRAPGLDLTDQILITARAIELRSEYYRHGSDSEGPS